MARSTPLDEVGYHTNPCPSVEVVIVDQHTARVPYEAIRPYENDIRQDVNRNVRQWALKHNMDMLWEWVPVQETFHLHCVNLDGERSLFPRQFLSWFLGRETPLYLLDDVQVSYWWTLGTLSQQTK